MRPHRISARAIVSILLLAAAACGDSTAPSMQSVAGVYVGTRLTTTTGGVTTDELADGSSVALTLSANGTTAGRLFVPANDPGEEELDANLAGTWTLSGTTVQLTHAADTFLRDMPLEVRGNTLVGDRTFGSTRVQLTLTKQ